MLAKKNLRKLVPSFLSMFCFDFVDKEFKTHKTKSVFTVCKKGLMVLKGSVLTV